ncbi:MAG: alpha/beta hydrolase-fold protein [Planctomycetota bacterium]
MFDRLKRALTGTSSESKASASIRSGPSDQELLTRWKSVALDGRQVDIFPCEEGQKPSAVVLFLHGHGRVLLNQNPVFTRLFHEHQLAAICPDGERSWWLDVPCSEFHESRTPQQWLLQSIVPWIGSQFEIQPPRIALLGVSMGGQGALQLAYRHASMFPVVAAIAPAVDFHQLYGSGIPLDGMFTDAESARQATVVLNLHPLAWPRYQYFCCDPSDTEWFDGAARLGMKLSSSGILHERDLETSAGGHNWNYFNHMAAPALRHIAESLQKVA